VLLQKERELVVETARKMISAGLVMTTWGNVSIRDPEQGLVAITPSGTDYFKMGPEDIVITDLFGKVVEGYLKPSSETPLHTMVYRERPEVNSVIHTHSPFATAMSVAGMEIPVVLAEAASSIGGTIRIAPYTPGGTEEFGRAALAAMGPRKGALLKNHGVIGVGPNIAKAFNTVCIIEDAAKVYFIARMLGNVDCVPGTEESFLASANSFQVRYGQEVRR